MNLRWVERKQFFLLLKDKLRHINKFKSLFEQKLVPIGKTERSSELYKTEDLQPEGSGNKGTYIRQKKGVLFITSLLSFRGWQESLGRLPN